MADDHQENRGFTVADKRRFVSADTEPEEPRPSEGDEQRSYTQKRAETDAGAGRREQPEGGGETRGGEERTRGGSGGARSESEEPTLEITMATFIMSMSTQALMLMGEIASPTTEQVERDVKAAKQVIDILGMLRQKTDRNLDDNERSLFEHVLYDLRMRYVEIMKGESRG